MHRPRPIHSILSLLVALGLVLAPMSAHAGGARPGGKPAAKPLSKTSQKKVNDAFKNTGANKAEKAKALTSLSGAMAKRADLRRSPNKQAAYVKASVTNQRGAAGRSTTTTSRTKGKANKSKNKQKNKTKNKQKTKKSKSGNGGAVDEDAAELDDGDDVEVDEGDDADDEDLTPDEVQDVIDNADFDEENVSDAFDALDEAEELEAAGDKLGALQQEIFYHDMMAYEAELTAEAYDEAGEPEQAETIRAFGRMNARDSTALKGQYLKLQKQNGGQGGEPEASRVQPAQGFFGKMKANRAARKLFRARIKADASGRLATRYGQLNRQQRSGIGLIGTGLSIGVLIKTGTAIAAGTAGLGSFVFAGLAAFGVVSAGKRELKVRSNSRKLMARELQQNKQLSQTEIETYQAAGWI